MSKLKTDVIRYSKKLNITNLSALRSGNISVRAKEKGVDGFYITPSGMKYASLKTKDIVFVSLKGIFDKKKNKPSSEWRFHQDIYVNKKEAKAILATQYADQGVKTAQSDYARYIKEINGKPLISYTIEEAKKKAKEFFDKGNTSDLPWEQYDGTTELMSVEENGGASVTEIYTDMGDMVYHDGNANYLPQIN